ncbi:hypothetical protein FBALC1_01172 [Flavobacteriales bacterium ALC-1]|nr:hypothetical protein FBALC1_01172 [Flavobacteriales bacterium ALC-1]
MNILKIITAICSVLFFMVGFDKFFPFMEPPCSLIDNISTTLWKGLGGIQLAAGILIWFSKLRRYVAGFFVIILLFFTIYHLKENTYDIGGSTFMAVLLGILVWNPTFLQGKRNNL